jgi:hypothetical protein
MAKATLIPLIRAMDHAQLMKVCVNASLPVVEERVKQSYDNSKTAYNRNFVPLKKPKGLPPVIGLRDYYRYAGKQDAISITSSKSYAGYHHTGTRYIPARSPFPKNDKLPMSWKRPMVEAIKASLEELFRK